MFISNDCINHNETKCVKEEAKKTGKGGINLIHPQNTYYMSLTSTYELIVLIPCIFFEKRTPGCSSVMLR